MLDFEELKMLLQETRKNVDQINLTLNNLLYWAKGQMEMPGSNREIFDLEAMTEKLLLVYQPLSMSKKVSLIIDASGLCTVFADINEINLVMRNLIDNAIKFSPSGSVIRLTMERQAERVQVSVNNEAQDNNAEKLAALLNPEVFSSSPGTNNEQGIGLGLHLCREYINQNGGEMSVIVGDLQITISFSLPIEDKMHTQS
ncbi:MAG: HAMP domain-containing histidine kinase [Pedobacter sp.]|nr:MAG: HAMP domain-containing histidine kinase [Pedobacter sp.]